jgi:hypothetical protein
MCVFGPIFEFYVDKTSFHQLVSQCFSLRMDNPEILTPSHPGPASCGLDSAPHYKYTNTLFYALRVPEKVGVNKKLCSRRNNGLNSSSR